MKSLKLPMILLSTVAMLGGSYHLQSAEATKQRSVQSTDSKSKNILMAGTDTVTFRDAHHGFLINLPDTWQLQEGATEQGFDFVVVAMSPAENESDTFIENMNVLVEEMKKDVSQDDYFAWNLSGLIQQLPGFSLQEKSNVVVDGIKMSRVKYAWGAEKEKTVTYQYIFVHGKKGYVITFTAQPNTFDEYRETFDKIAESFKFQ